jgi:hypothetical protein
VKKLPSQESYARKNARLYPPDLDQPSVHILSYKRG